MRDGLNSPLWQYTRTLTREHGTVVMGGEPYLDDSERESIQALEAERDDISTEPEELSETPAGDVSNIDAEIDRLRDHKQSLESTISQLQRVLQFNEKILEGGNFRSPLQFVRYIRTAIVFNHTTPQ